MALLESLADEPATVLCDLSGVTGAPDAAGVGLLASVAAEVRQWPGTAVGVVCPAPDLRESLGRQPDSEHLVIADRRRRVLAGLARRPAADGGPRAAAPGGAIGPGGPRPRRAHLPGLGVQRPGRSRDLVVSELVTNAMLHAGTDLSVSVARCGPWMRLAVRDANSRPPAAPPSDTSQVDRARDAAGRRGVRGLGRAAHQ